MGFYGNITNTSNTTFSFDRIYPNRLSMDTNANNDGIFIGRYVLVEYERNAAYPVVYTKVIDGHLQFYSSPKCEDITRIKFGTGSDEIDENDIVKSYPEGTDSTTVDGGEWPINIDNVKFYRCTGSEKVEETYYAIFSEITDKNDVFGQKSDYILNYAIDENHYYPQDEAERRTYKGYDSTVWVKSSVTASDGKLITKYVNIADLNSVVPTFDIAADAPTMTPITPHFDADSTNVYYKLHAQPQWGFRIAQTSADKSDETTQWARDFYDPTTDTASKKYATGTTNGIPNWSSETPVDLNAAIYFNEAAFKKQLVDTSERQGEIKKHSRTVNEDTIKIEPTGKSGVEYNIHNGKESPSKAPQIDTQELTINLPSIGNMMSDAWDIIHGPNRDNARTDNNGSLQGRLDSFEAFYNNQIPVKKHTDGTIIGSKINNAIKYSDWVDKPEDILDDKTSPNFERDDAWIKTEINTNGLKAGDKNSSEDQGSNSGISIHHTFHATSDSETSLDKNDNSISHSETTYKQDYIPKIVYSEDNIVTAVNGGDEKNIPDQNEIKLYTPYVDATGHVVGKNIETITLPYGYKTFTTEGLAPLDNENKEIVEDLYTTISNQEDGNNISSSSAFTSISVANNTQDSIAIEPYNKWIQTQLSNDKLVIAHEVHAINTEKDTTDLNDLQDNQIQNTINIPDWDYDEAGHIKKKGEHIYTLPYGYKTIKVENSDSVLGAPFHTGEGKETATNTQDNLKFTASNRWIKMMPTGENDIEFGHILSPIAPEDEKIKLNSILHKSTDTNISEFGGSFNILNFTTDNAGHIIAVGQDIITIPQGKYEKDTPNSESSSLIVGMKLDGPTGEIITTSATTNTLRLADYSLPTSVDNSGVLASNQSINEAFGRLEYRINEEINKREAAFDLLYYGEEGKEGKTISKAFDTIKEIADFLEQDANGKQSGVEKILSDIEANSDNIAQEKLRAESAENANTTLINQEISRASEEEGKLNTRINDLVGDTKVSVQIDNKINTFKSTLGSAAYTESDMYALAGSYDDRVLQSVYDTKIAELEATIRALNARIEALESKSENPVEGE